MAKKPAESEESDDTGSASEVGSQSEAVGSQSEAATSSQSEVSEASESSEAAKASDAKDEASEADEPKKKKGVSGRSKRVTGKHPSVKAPAARSAPRGSGHELVPVICSECYEELVFDSGVKSDVLTCPICEHQAARPDDAQLAIIGEKRKQEKTNFVIGFLLCVVSMIAFGVWIWVLRNPHTNAVENGPGFYGPVAVSGLAYLGCLIFTLSKYESARHDVYF